MRLTRPSPPALRWPSSTPSPATSAAADSCCSAPATAKPLSSTSARKRRWPPRRPCILTPRATSFPDASQRPRLSLHRHARLRRRPGATPSANTASSASSASSPPPSSSPPRASLSPPKKPPNSPTPTWPQFPESKRIFQRDGDYYKAGEIFRQPELARTLQRIAADPDDFYHGKMARELVDDLRKGGALLTLKDLAQYTVVEREPIVGSFHNYTIISAPPPSSGGIVLISASNILEGYNLARLGDRTAASPSDCRSLSPRLHGPRRLPRRSRITTTIPIAAN